MQAEHAHKNTHPNTPAKSGGAQPKPEPKHTHPHRAPVPGVAGCKRSAHTSTQTAQHPSQEWQAHLKPKPKHTHPHRAAVPGVAGCKRSTHTNTHTPTLSEGWRGAAQTRAQTHTPTCRTRARSGWVQAERAHEHTHSQTSQSGVVGRSRIPGPNTHTHTAHLCQEWLGASEVRTQTRTPQHPSHEWRGAVET